MNNDNTHCDPAEGFCTECRQAAANKAAEEGGLPDEGFLYGYFRKNGKHFDMLKGRPNVHTLSSGWVPLYTTKEAADRAYRPQSYSYEQAHQYAKEAVAYDRASRQDTGAQKLLAELTEAADVFMKGGVAPLRQKIDQAKLFCSGITAGSASRQVANKAEVDLSSLDRYIVVDDQDERPDLQKQVGGALVLFSDVEALLAAPSPAKKSK